MTRPNVIAVLRVSTDAQDVARQRTDLKRLQARFGLNVVRTLELIGVSGTETLNDEQVQQVLADLERPDIDGVALSALDRLFRPGKSFRQWAILAPFQEWSKKIWSQMEGEINPDTTEGYEKCITAGGRAGAEWRILKERTAAGRRERLEEGRIVNPTPKYGYIYIRKNQPGGGRFEIAAEPARVVKQVFHWYAHDGLSMWDISKRLNDAGILSAGHNGKPGGLWSRQTVWQMLKSATYVGEHRCSGILVRIPAIVDRTTFEIVQRHLKENRQRLVGRPSNKYLLRRYLWCGKCGHRCTSSNAGSSRLGESIIIRYYRCSHVTNKPPIRRLCPALGVRQAVIEEAAWRAIWGLLLDPEELRRHGNAYNDRQRKPGESQKLTAEVDKLRRLQTAIVTLIRRGRLDADEGEKDLKVLEAQIAQLEQKLSALGKMIELAPLDVLKKQMTEIYDPRDEPKTYEERRPVLEGLRDLRMNYYDGELEITGSVPVAAAPSSSEKNCHSSLRPNSDRQRNHRHQSEARALQQHPAAVLQILPKPLDENAHARYTHAAA